MSFVSLTDTVRSLRWLGARWSSLFFAGASAAELGFYRILFYGYILFFFALRVDISRWAEVSDVFWSPTSLFRLFHLPLLSATGLTAVVWAWRLSLALTLVGLYTRASTLAALALGFYVIGLPQNFGKVNHNDAIVVIGLAVFAFSRCGDAWSLDWLRRAQPRAGGSYSWPVELYRLMLALVFFSAGVAKLSGAGPVAWVLSNNLYYTILAHHYTHSPSSIGLLLTRYPWMCQLLAGSALALELAAPLLILLTVRWRTLLAAAMVAMMLGFWQMLGVFFRDFIALLVIFFHPVEAGGSVARRRIGVTPPGRAVRRLLRAMQPNRWRGQGARSPGPCRRARRARRLAAGIRSLAGARSEGLPGGHARHHRSRASPRRLLRLPRPRLAPAPRLAVSPAPVHARSPGHRPASLFLCRSAPSWHRLCPPDVRLRSACRVSMRRLREGHRPTV
jgi:HTTM domain